MISASVVVPFQKGPCGEGGRMRGFLLPLLEEASVVVLVLFLLIFLCGCVSSIHCYYDSTSSRNTKVNRRSQKRIEESKRANNFGENVLCNVSAQV